MSEWTSMLIIMTTSLTMDFNDSRLRGILKYTLMDKLYSSNIAFLEGFFYISYFSFFFYGFQSRTSVSLWWWQWQIKPKGSITCIIACQPLVLLVQINHWHKSLSRKAMTLFGNSNVLDTPEMRPNSH